MESPTSIIVTSECIIVDDKEGERGENFVPCSTLHKIGKRVEVVTWKGKIVVSQ